MKIKILFLSFICIATLLSLFFSKEKQLRIILTLYNIESLAAGEDGQYSCTASTDCYNMIGQYLVLVMFVAVVLIGQVKEGLNAMEIKHIVNDPMP